MMMDREYQMMAVWYDNVSRETTTMMWHVRRESMPDKRKGKREHDVRQNTEGEEQRSL